MVYVLKSFDINKFVLFFVLLQKIHRIHNALWFVVFIVLVWYVFCCCCMSIPVCSSVHVADLYLSFSVFHLLIVCVLEAWIVVVFASALCIVLCVLLFHSIHQKKINKQQWNNCILSVKFVKQNLLSWLYYVCKIENNWRFKILLLKSKQQEAQSFQLCQFLSTNTIDMRKHIPLKTNDVLFYSSFYTHELWMAAAFDSLKI